MGSCRAYVMLPVAAHLSARSAQTPRREDTGTCATGPLYLGRDGHGPSIKAHTDQIPTRTSICLPTRSRSRSWYSVTMRLCQSCNDPIADTRRKDARFCTKPGCRARDFRRRKREQATAHPPAHTQKPNESVIITCSCGNRLWVQVTHLGPAEPRSSEPPSAERMDSTEQAQPVATESAAVTRTVPNATSPADTTVEARPRLAPSRVSPAQSVAPNGSQPNPPSQHTDLPELLPVHQEESIAVTRTVLPAASAIATAPELPAKPALLTDKPAQTAELPSPRSGAHEPQPIEPTVQTLEAPRFAIPPPLRAPEIPSFPERTTSSSEPAFLVQRTCELMGSIRGGRLLSLSSVIQRYRDGRMELAPGVDLYLCRTPHEGHGISGSPGCWRELYPHTSPTRFGQDADLAIVGWDEHERRAVAIPENMLRQLVGNDWREKVRAAVSWNR